MKGSSCSLPLLIKVLSLLELDASTSLAPFDKTPAHQSLTSPSCWPGSHHFTHFPKYHNICIQSSEINVGKLAKPIIMRPNRAKSKFQLITPRGQLGSSWTVQLVPNFPFDRTFFTTITASISDLAVLLWNDIDSSFKFTSLIYLWEMTLRIPR